MDRRLAGLAVLILAVVAVTVVPGVSGRRVAGSAEPKSFPDPPAVGDCALYAPSRAGSRYRESPDVDVTSVTWGPCTGPIAGEVVAAGQSGTGRSGTGRSATDSGSSGDDPVGRCYVGTAGYAGLKVDGTTVTLAAVPPTDRLSWEPVVGANTQLVVPGDEERRAGRSWWVCLVTPLDGGSYRGTLAQGFVSGRIPDVYGVCWNGTDLDEQVDLLGCGRPHSAQLLAIGVAPDRSRVSTNDLQSACVDVATAIMRTDRPVRAGELAAVLDIVTSDGASTPDAPLTAGCFVAAVGTRQLNGSVIGLDDRPVPFVN